MTTLPLVYSVKENNYKISLYELLEIAFKSSFLYALFLLFTAPVE